MDRFEIAHLLTMQEQAELAVARAERDHSFAKSRSRRAVTHSILNRVRRELAMANDKLDNVIRKFAQDHGIRLQERASLKLVLLPGNIHLYEYPDYYSGPGFYVIDAHGNVTMSQPPRDPELRIYLA